MKKYLETENYVLYNSDMRNMQEDIAPNSIDSIICDPPYELGFMGKSWDSSGIAFQKETWQHCYNVLKPGGYLLAFGGSRTFHRIACAIEDAGFEIRDTIMWLYGSGFPKSMNIGLAIDKKNGIESEIVGYQGSMMDFRDTGKKQKEVSGIDKLSFGQIENSERKENPIYKAKNEFAGWGTCLKPAYEPIIVARKPVEGSCVDNVMKYGVGGINIDECRVGKIGGVKKVNIEPNSGSKNCNFGCNGDLEELNKGRFPANVILTYDETDKDEVCGGMPDTNPTHNHSGDGKSLDTRNMGWGFKRMPCNIEDNGGSAARYFYCAKASKKDRDEGLDLFEEKKVNDGRNTPIDNAFQRGETERKNIHPTVKPIELMQYLVRLVSPKDATIMDCFMGSGSTGKAVMFENRERNANYKFIGIEMTDEYLPICASRIDYALNKYEYDIDKENQEDKENGILNIFDFIEEQK